VLPGIERQPRKKLEPSPERLLAVLHGWRMRRSGPVTRSRGLRWPSMPAATASGWRAGFFGGPAELTIRGGGNRETNMALMPENGPAARSFAANAHDCIMVRIRMDLPHTSLRRKDAPQWRAPLGFVSKALSDAGASQRCPSRCTLSLRVLRRHRRNLSPACCRAKPFRDRSPDRDFRELRRSCGSVKPERFSCFLQRRGIRASTSSGTRCKLNLNDRRGGA
jgi:hypothetical protein